MKPLYKKSISRNYLLLFTVLFTMGCSEEWLEPKPLSIFTPENVFADARGMSGALSACDRDLRDEFYGDAAPITTELWFSEMCVCGTTDKPGPLQNMNIQLTPTSPMNSTNHNRIGWYWQNFYEGIKYANTVISRINTGSFKDETERNAVLGSAYFHRAYRYYRLIHQFGDIPYIGKEITEPRLDFQSTKREVILRKLKKDMEFALVWCSDNVERGRVSKGACAHLLTKINLALGEFDDAIASASSIIDGGVYQLMRNPFGEIPQEAGDYLRNLGVVRSDVISRLHWCVNKAVSANKEVLCMVISSEDYINSRSDLYTMRCAIPAWGSSSANRIYTPDGRAGTSDLVNQEYKLVETFGRGTSKARNTSYHSKRIWDDPNDLRHKRYNWINMEDLVYNNADANKGKYYGKPLQLRSESGGFTTNDTILRWFGWPHYKIYNPDPRRPQPYGGAYDWYIFRLAETYLLRAEAYWWKNDMARAMADVNQVRTRAGCAPYTDLSKFDIGTILDERARELYYEEPRKTELTRMAFIFAQTGRSYKGKTYSIANFGTSNFNFDRIMESTDFYNKGVKANNGQEFTMSPYHVLWPIPQDAISANTLNVINQNYGYDGFEKNIAPLTEIPPDDL